MKKNTNWIMIFCLATLLVVFIFYLPTTFFQLKAFDELMPFHESFLPVCFSFSEMYELISLLGLNHYFEATNTLYSDIVSLRSNPAGTFLVLLVQLIFQKNSVAYHMCSLVLHLINAALIFLMMNKATLYLNKSESITSAQDEQNNKTRLSIISLLTLLWALHPINIESVLLLSNTNTLIGHTLCFLTVYIYIKQLPFDFKPIKQTLSRFLILFLPFMIALFTAEYNFMLPFILFIYTIAMKLYFNYKSTSFSKSFPICLRETLSETLPLFIAAFLFVIAFIFSPSRINIGSHSLILILERIFWLSPQILFHFFKLVFFPIKLSIDQTFLLRLGKSLFDPYAVFCFSFIFIIICLSFLSLIKATSKLPFFFITFLSFLLSLVPYSQILAPSYNLVSERYLYLPLFLLIFGFSHLLFNNFQINTSINKMPTKILLFILFSLMCTYTTRDYFRTLDWKDNITFYKSAIKATNNPLYKAFRYMELTSQDKLLIEYPEEAVEPKYKKLAIKNLKKAIELLKIEKDKFQLSTPLIIKNYGLDPRTLLAKAEYLLAKVDFSLNNDIQKALSIMQNNIEDPDLLSTDALAFYSSLFYFSDKPDKAEELLRLGYKKDPYSLRIVFSLCDFILIKYGNLAEIEKYALKAFKYYPYDTKTLLLLTKLYKVKGEREKYAYFSYVYGLRTHSLEDLKIAHNLYLLLNNKDRLLKAENRIVSLEKILSGRD